MKSLKRPYVFSLLMTLIILIFPIFAGVIIFTQELGQVEAKLIQGIALAVGGIIGIIIGKRYFGPLKNIGLKKTPRESISGHLFFFPLILLEGLALIFGFRDNLSLNSIFAFLFFTLVVGFTEEMYFRGLIPKALESKGLLVCVVVSCILFSFGHIANILGGAGLFDTLFQILFAFLFGFVALLIRLSTGSLFVPIVWHFLHNFLSLISAQDQGNRALIVGCIQCVILVLYGGFLWAKVHKKEGVLKA